MKKNAIFGTGLNGLKVLEELGHTNVGYFISNSKKYVGRSISGIPILLPSDFVELKDEFHVVIASIHAESMELQLLNLGVTDYSVVDKMSQRIYETDQLILNPYEKKGAVTSESEWNEQQTVSYDRDNVRAAAELWHHREIQLFRDIQIETINRCNGVCSFCPVNCKDDPREKKVMPEALFKSIVNQLEELNYADRFGASSNNEPLLDKRIIGLIQYARRHLPLARLYMYTNGTLLTIEKFQALVDTLDELIIDNYQQDLKLIPSCEKIQEYCELHPELKRKVTIVLRKPNEILTSRGGNAPNRQVKIDYPDDKCVLPFRHMIVRPDGKVSLCCNDALGEHTIGDLSKETIQDVWYGENFKKVRESLYQGRKLLGKCRYCDTFYT